MLPAHVGLTAPVVTANKKADAEVLDIDDIFLGGAESDMECIQNNDELAPVEDDDDDYLFAGLLSDSSVD